MDKNNNEFLLMSIKTKYANKIFGGTKAYEYRSRSIGDKNLNKFCLIYSSEEDKSVIGYVIFDKIIEGPYEELVNKTNPESIDRLKNYLKDKYKGFALHVKEYKRFNKSITLDELRKNNNKFNIPQYYRYIKEDEYLYTVAKSLKK